MEYTELINEEQGEFETKRLALTGCGFEGEPSNELQLQIEQDGNDAYIDLSVSEAKQLADKIVSWVESKNL